ncbi:MAG: class I SAM-dependent methyltransferase [Deltaproteobacteria bacterium]|nr:class I SAM-dependent methyltransferase [Deltaproteobacteria bacterium]
MGRLGPDDRPGYQTLETIVGYDRWAPTYDNGSNPLIAVEQQVMLDLIGNVSGQKILDLGCGTGRYSALLADKGASIVGIDPSTEMVAQARDKVSSLSSVSISHGTIDDMRFEDGSFDVVVSALVASHLPDLDPFLREVTRVLKSCGRFFLSDIHPYWAVSGHDYVEFFDPTGQEYRIPQHSHLIEEYWVLFKELGLRLEELREPKIESWLVERLPFLDGYQGLPLALILSASKGTL